MNAESFDQTINEWLTEQMDTANNPRRKEILKKGLGHATKEFLRKIWYPTVGNFHHLYAEWEVRDYGNRYRYLDLAYMPGGAKGCIEIHGYRSHARDIEAWRFMDLCKKQAYLTLDDWAFLPIAYLSIEDEAEVIKQMTLAFVGKFVTSSSNPNLNWIEAEALRFARGIMRPFRSDELAQHLQRSNRQTRRILHKLVQLNILRVENNQQRYRTYQMVHLRHTQLS